MDVKQFLTSVFLFESLTEQQIEQIEAATAVKEIEKGEHLFHEGQPATAFFIVVSGSVKIYKLSSEGNEHILHVQIPSDLIAEAIIFDFKEYPAYCQALEKTTLLRISIQQFLELLRCFPEISFRVMRAYSKRIRQLVNKIEELSLHDVKSRLANYLVQNLVLEEGKCICCLTLSKKDLASVLGTIPETISRALNYLKKEGIIEVSREMIIIKRLADLKRLSA